MFHVKRPHKRGAGGHSVIDNDCGEGRNVLYRSLLVTVIMDVVAGDILFVILSILLPYRLICWVWV